jgi:hypothetical protein
MNFRPRGAPHYSTVEIITQPLKPAIASTPNGARLQSAISFPHGRSPDWLVQPARLRNTFRAKTKVAPFLGPQSKEAKEGDVRKGDT